MIFRYLNLLLIAYAFVHITACVDNHPSSKRSGIVDSAFVKEGERLFYANCATCHHFNREGIGPQLAGITDSVTTGWLHGFIRNPDSVYHAGDERVVRQVHLYKKVMPAFPGFTDVQLDQLIAFIRSHKRAETTGTDADTTAFNEPFRDSIMKSGLVIGLDLITQVPVSSSTGKPPLARITKLDFRRHDKTLFVADMRGKLYRVDEGRPSVYMDLAALESAFVHEPGLGAGFGSFAFHPDFSENGLLYTVHTEAPGAIAADFSYPDSIKVTYQYVLKEWKAKDIRAPRFSGKGREILRVNMVTVQHGIQEIAFNPYATRDTSDFGKLFIGVGDGGAIDGKHLSLVHSPARIWGTVLRIDPSGNNSQNGKYGIPADNPFAGNAGYVEEIYAYGFRNPHRISWNRHGRMFVANIGEVHIESVYDVHPGKDHGWPIREGAFMINPYGDLSKLYPLPTNDSVYDIEYPIAQYDHDWGYAAISGGFVYEGKAIPSLQNKYLFGDIPSGKIFYFHVNGTTEPGHKKIMECELSLGGVKTTLKQLCGSNRVDLHFGKDADGELYILTKADGKIYKLIR